MDGWIRRVGSKKYTTILYFVHRLRYVDSAQTMGKIWGVCLTQIKFIRSRINHVYGGKIHGQSDGSQIRPKDPKRKGIETGRGVRKRHGYRELVMYMSPHTT